MSEGSPAAFVLNRLDLKTLRLFATICEEGTLNGAARRAAIAPSAVSKRLAELERALCCELLTREPRGMRTTPAGETLLHHTRRMLASAEQISLELAEHSKGLRGFVRVVANLSAIVQFLPEDLQAFMAMQDGIAIDLEERPSGARPDPVPVVGATEWLDWVDLRPSGYTQKFTEADAASTPDREPGAPF